MRKTGQLLREHVRQKRGWYRYSVTASAESQFNGFSVWIASAGAGTAL